uniref:Nuclear envelope integral membrane protein 2 n=1 Tax=Mus musculus TaxID=10090 RepID=A0A087WQD9_MOUSE
MLPRLWWLVLWLQPLATLPASAVHDEEAAMSVPRCKSLKETDLIKTSVSDCYCYNQHSQIQWTYMWSTVQVTVTSPGLLNIVYITGSHNCQHTESILSFIKCVTHNFWAPEEAEEITIVFSPYGETVCFSVKPVGRLLPYIVSVSRNIVDFKLFLVFVTGIFLFLYAKTLSQSPVFYYSSGTVLGILMTLVFVLLMAKKHIPKAMWWLLDFVALLPVTVTGLLLMRGAETFSCGP